MKKALLYVATAIFMGKVTMVVPLMLLKPRYYELITSPSVKKYACNLGNTRRKRIPSNIRQRSKNV